MGKARKLSFGEVKIAKNDKKMSEMKKRKSAPSDSRKLSESIRKSTRKTAGVTPQGKNYPTQFLSKTMLDFVSVSTKKNRSQNGKENKESKISNLANGKQKGSSSTSSTSSITSNQHMKRKLSDTFMEENEEQLPENNLNKRRKSQAKQTQSSSAVNSKRVPPKKQSQKGGRRKSKGDESSQVSNQSLDLSQTKKKPKSRIYDSPESPEMRKSKFYETDVRKWKRMDNSILSHITTLVNSGIDAVLNRYAGEDYSAVQKCLQSCNTQLSAKLKILKTPHNTFKDYKKLQKLKLAYREESEMYEKQENRLEDAVEQEEITCDNLEEEIDKERRELESLEELAEESEFHPLLKAFDDYVPVLMIPSLPK